MDAATPAPLRTPPTGKRLAGLSLVALGVVYGDIGTSPLYAVRESFDHGIAPVRENVLGILSLITWSLILVISIKYISIVLRANNRGEGGILALMALAHPRREGVKRSAVLVLLGLFGAALLYGDGMITPAISVLSAVEGVSIAAPALSNLVIPITLGILAGLFWFQKRGTRGVGSVFGPVTLVWFLTLFALGLRQILGHPEVLQALVPTHAVAFIGAHGWTSLAVLGSVFLVVTGGEALYADMGHFGTRPIRLVWFLIVLPCLLTNYMGQGALILADPATVENPFYAMAPSWGLVPLIFLATAATVIASQAIITGAFSLTSEAVRLGYLPRLRIHHTSETEAGQIYVPLVNWTLMVACFVLVGTFRSSSALAGAYGVAVTMTEIITTIWNWRLPAVAALAALFLAIEFSFFSANALKIPNGGWFPLLIAAAAFSLMATWRKGRRILASALAHERVPMKRFIGNLRELPPLRVPGTAVYMNLDARGPPPALLRNLQHHGVLHERLVLLTVNVEEVPYIMNRKRVAVQRLDEGVWRVVASYGFMEEPHVARILELCKHEGLQVDPGQSTFFVGLERVLSTPARSGMAYWRERLFGFMMRNATRPSTYFQLPKEQVIEVGVQVGI